MISLGGSHPLSVFHRLGIPSPHLLSNAFWSKQDLTFTPTLSPGDRSGLISS